MPFTVRQYTPGILPSRIGCRAEGLGNRRECPPSVPLPGAPLRLSQQGYTGFRLHKLVSLSRARLLPSFIVFGSPSIISIMLRRSDILTSADFFERSMKS